jgi:hypothetical protein
VGAAATATASSYGSCTPNPHHPHLGYFCHLYQSDSWSEVTQIRGAAGEDDVVWTALMDGATLVDREGETFFLSEDRACAVAESAAQSDAHLCSEFGDSQ